MQPPTDDAAPSRAPASRGPSKAVRIVIGVVVAAVVVVLLFTVVFPWVVEYQQDPTLEGAPAPAHAAAVARR